MRKDNLIHNPAKKAELSNKTRLQTVVTHRYIDKVCFDQFNYCSLRKGKNKENKLYTLYHVSFTSLPFWMFLWFTVCTNPLLRRGRQREREMRERREERGELSKAFLTASHLLFDVSFGSYVGFSWFGIILKFNIYIYIYIVYIWSKKQHIYLSIYLSL